jgi:cadmium resistance protein CadD (predicted permease)
VQVFETLIVAAVVFASTNVDDILLLSAFFAQPSSARLGHRRRAVSRNWGTQVCVLNVENLTRIIPTDACVHP